MKLENVRLLHLLKSLDIGGIEKSTVIYSNELVEKLNFIGIFSPEGIFSKQNLIKENIQLFNKVKGSIGINKYFYKNLLYLISVVKENKINIIFYHFRIYLPFILILKLLYPDIQIVYVAHSYFNDYLNYLIYANKHIAISTVVINDLKRFGKSNIAFIPHGIKINNDFTTQKTTIKNIGYIGRFESNKGINILLNAFKELLIEYHFITLSFIGEGNEERNIISFRDNFNLQNSIFLKHPILSESELFKAIDLLILPSTSLEGFGLVTIEAMKWEIPVIASDFIKTNTLIENFRTGILFKNHDQKDLMDKIRLLINNNDLYQDISRNAKEMIKNKFNINSTISKYLEFFQNI